MKRIASLFAAAALVATMFVLGASPASASPDVCVGQGNASTGLPLYYPGVSLTGTNTTFSFNISIGQCVLGHAASASGSLSGLTGGGYCGHSIGSGTVGGHHSFQWVSAGSLLVISGQAAGVVNAVPDATTGESCVSGADKFLVTGVVALI